MTEESGAGKELDLDVAGQHVRAKGYRLIDLIWLPLVLGVGYCATALYQIQAAAQGDKRLAVEQVEKTHKIFLDALKENNQNTVQALKEVTAEQRKSTNAMREIACLSDPTMKNRTDAREFCKRISRDDR